MLQQYLEFGYERKVQLQEYYLNKLKKPVESHSKI